MGKKSGKTKMNKEEKTKRRDEVRALRNGRPPLSDIPAMMRQMADWIEKGEIEIDPIHAGVLFIIPRNNDWPDIYGWGDHLGDHGNIAICDLAKAWFMHNLTKRAV